MTGFVKKIAAAVFLSFLVNAPFAIGELLTRDTSGLRTDFPFTLFIGLWVEMGLFVYLLMSALQSFRTGTASKKPFLLGIQILILGVLAWAWVTLIIDQWPCFFLGGSGC